MTTASTLTLEIVSAKYGSMVIFSYSIELYSNLTRFTRHFTTKRNGSLKDSGTRLFTKSETT